MARFRYKGYRIETTACGELGEWEGWAKITADVPAIHSPRPLNHEQNGYCTPEEAQIAVWKEAKKKIDEVIR